MGKTYLVYIMANRKHGAIYTGVTGHPERRVWQHKNHVFEDSFTDRYGCTKLVWHEVYEAFRSSFSARSASGMAAGLEGPADRGDETGLAEFVEACGALT